MTSNQFEYFTLVTLVIAFLLFCIAYALVKIQESVEAFCNLETDRIRKKQKKEELLDATSEYRQN